eukprot:TRINITY_DN9318_c0_g1_i1.p1 TRINITY_DN9318_c0_g1~~TRINITY_DN9318_c0_g1_i1.p1  ORF type:complete len:374 (-),score=64.07 TRINITY_DN9318_c0_g1_i1:36-1157(-)
MSTKNMAAVLYSANDLRYEEIPIPQPKENQVQIAIKTVGICGSDDHYYKHGRIWDFIVKDPMILGHESSGVITAVGKNVSHLQVGDPVAIEPGVPCTNCDKCKSGLYNLCPLVQFCATPPVNGTLCNYYCHDAAYVFKIPVSEDKPGFKDHLFEKAALLEPTSVAVHACGQAQVSEGDKILILGAGSIGVLNMLTAKAYGAKTVLMTDVSQSQLDFASKAGADFVVNVRELKGTPAEIAKHLIEKVGGLFDACIECSGFEQSIQTGIHSVKPNGNVVLVGMADPEPKIPVSVICVRELKVKGIFRYRHTYPKAIDLVASGKLNLECMIPPEHGKFTLDKVHEAFAVGFPAPGTTLPHPKPIKVMIDCSIKGEK